MLHPSTDLIDLRHAQLRFAGFPEAEKSTASMVRLETGTMWHNRLHDRLRHLGIPYMAEVKLDPWLPEGWAGTADWLILDPTKSAFVLADIKTTTGQGVGYRATEGMSESHWLQASAYWHAANRMGLPMVEKVIVFYLPLDDSGSTELLVSEDVPAEASEMDEMMDEIREECIQFANGDQLPDDLAPPIERVQKVNWNNATKVFDLKLHPHWLTRYCPFGDVCGCGDQPTTKIGHYYWDVLEEKLVYVPRKGWEDTEPTTSPNRTELRKRFSSPS
jgi:hypothetical protein